MFKAKGTLIYDPKSDSATRKGFQSWWAKLDVPQSIVSYYQYWVKKELGIQLNSPLWRSHVTVNRGETPRKPYNWRKYQNEVIDFEYGADIRMSDTYVWLPVSAPRLNEIRAELGLAPNPRVAFHITVGNRKNREDAPETVKAPFRIFPWEDAKNIDFLWKRFQRAQSKK